MAVINKGVRSYEGRVLGKYTREERVMSDIYADVSYALVAEADGKITDLYLKAHFELCDYVAYAEVDATPEVRALTMAYTSKSAAEKTLEAANANVTKLAADAKPVAAVPPAFKVGDLALVTGKTPGLVKDEFMTVCWVGTSKFNGGGRVAFMVDGKRVYCSESKVTRVSSTTELAAADDAAQAATEQAKKARAGARVTAAFAVEDATESLKMAVEAYEAALEAVRLSEVAPAATVEAA